jgi:hypothetical protein
VQLLASFGLWAGNQLARWFAVSFARARYSGGEVSFEPEARTWFGAEKRFARAEFSGGEVDSSSVDDWSFPPAFPWTDTPPPVMRRQPHVIFLTCLDDKLS